jgi:NDP-sugar pyrophosphorylase family protein
MSVTEAVLLAGGRGTRLLPYTMVIPKPLMPLDDMPIIEILLRQLRAAGVTRVHLSIGHLGDILKAYLENGAKLDIELRYVREEQPLGTAGPLALVEGLPENFFVLNGDVLTDLDFRELAASHEAAGAALTVSAYEKATQLSLGVLETDESGTLVNYVEKPTFHHLVSMGVYCMSRDALAYIERNQRLDLPDLVKRLIAAKRQVHTWRFAGHWLDMGTPEDYRIAFENFKKMRHIFLKE